MEAKARIGTKSARILFRHIWRFLGLPLGSSDSGIREKEKEIL
jgi:hypothetical protein